MNEGRRAHTPTHPLNTHTHTHPYTHTHIKHTHTHTPKHTHAPTHLLNTHAPLKVADGLGRGALVGHGAVVEEDEAVEAAEDLVLGLVGFLVFVFFFGGGE